MPFIAKKSPLIPKEKPLTLSLLKIIIQYEIRTDTFMDGNSTEKKGLFERSFFSSRIKSANVKFFPEAALGYLLGPIFALLSNSIINTYLTRYYTDVIGLTGSYSLYLVLLQLISAIVIIVGNVLVGKLMSKCKSRNGQARPLLFLSMPLIAIAIFSLFFVPFPEDSNNIGIITLVFLAISYNLYYAIAYPFYYTTHSALVNLSTRNSSHRGLLATLSNASAVGAAGLAGMFMPYFLNLLFVPASYDANGNIESYDRAASYNNWRILMIAMIVTLVIGVIIEFLFTRERITEEKCVSLAKRPDEEKPVQSVSISKQLKVCFHDKYWWMVMIFFFLYQLGGMMKNNSATYYSVALFGSSAMAGTISIVGAIPTAVGMVVIGALILRFKKARLIQIGGIIAALCGLIGFIGYGEGAGTTANGVTAILAFTLKACGTVPAMYISLALLSDVLDHQEALYGFRTDGFSMTVYGSIMVAMTGVANAIINGLLSVVGYNADNIGFADQGIRNMVTWIFFGGEVICYAIIAFIFIFMDVEKWSKLDHQAIEEDKKKQAEAEGIPYISSEERLKKEQEEADVVAYEASKAELKAKCEKKGLNYEEELAKFEKVREEKSQKALQKATLSAEKKAAKEAAKKAKYEALNDEEKDKIEKKEAIKADKESKLAAAYLAMREKAKESSLHI